MSGARAERSGRAWAPARAALAGNPSDGYGGAVLAVTIEGLGAEATALAAEHVDPGTGSEHIDPPSELVAAAAQRFRRLLTPSAPPARLSWSTAIPRAVGLGGSSAIVIATLRALCELHEVSLSPDALAELALAVETEELGIAAGPQDRLAQAYGGLTFMEFAADGRGRCEPMDPGMLPPLVVGWRERAGADSGPLHHSLGERYEAGEGEVRDALAAAADAARRARAALMEGDVQAFRACVDATFEARRRMLTLDPRHVEMIELARAAGAAANYTGSGGAIVAVCTDRAQAERVAERLRAAGCEAERIRRTPR